MSSILRKIKKKLGFAFSNLEEDEWAVEKLSNSGKFSNFRKENDGYRFGYRKQNFDVFARMHPHSDLSVAYQVLCQEEYSAVADLFKLNFPHLLQPRIIDAGANVGYTSLYFLAEFPGSQIACIEPDIYNAEALQRNLSSFISEGQVRVFRNGLFNVGGRNLETVNDFRDGKDWSVSVSEATGESALKSVSVNDVMATMKWSEVDILKMDIEGSERYVFQGSDNLDFLDRVHCLAIEIHDEFNCRQRIYDVLREKGFLMLNFGETTLAISKRMIRS